MTFNQNTAVWHHPSTPCEHGLIFKSTRKLRTKGKNAHSNSWFKLRSRLSLPPPQSDSVLTETTPPSVSSSHSSCSLVFCKLPEGSFILLLSVTETSVNTCSMRAWMLINNRKSADWWTQWTHETERTGNETREMKVKVFSPQTLKIYPQCDLFKFSTSVWHNEKIRPKVCGHVFYCLAFIYLQLR